MRTLTVLSCYLLFCFSCSESEKSENTATSVITEKVRKERVQLIDQYPGNTVALQEVELRADVTGYITNIHIEDGQRVEKGQLLYEIDKSRYQAQLDQSQSQLKIAKANLERLQRDMKRYEKLKEGNAIAAQVYDNALTDLNNASAELVSTQAQIDNDLTNLQYASIRAPFGGTIGFSEVRLGALVNPGQTLLNVISTDDPIGVDFFAEEKSLQKFQALIANKNRVLEDSTFMIRLPGGQLHPYPGTIENMDRAIDPNTGTIKMRLNFKNPNQTLKPGLSTSIQVKIKNDAMSVTIPQKATMEKMGETSVFLKEGELAIAYKVVLGRPFKDRVIVLEGLEEGQEIITSGIQKLNDGDKVVTINGGGE